MQHAARSRLFSRYNNFGNIDRRELRPPPPPPPLKLQLARLFV